MTVSDSPPQPPRVHYHAVHGTRWEKEKATAANGAFEYPNDPQFIGPWIIGECVGKGASGRVKIAKHRRTGQLAAVKILPLQPLVNSRTSLATQQAKFDKQRLGVDREITMMKLMNHPNIIRIYDVYEGEDELYLILEYVQGGELFDFLVNHGRLPPLEALAIFKQIVYGLNYAHTFSIIHRDLKPENILIHSINPPLIKIADWGMAAFAPPSLQLETSCGSPHYASPEIVNGEKYEGNATDVWSCGVILYALLTGRLPFDDKNVRTLLSKVKSGKYEMPSCIDPQARDLLARMLVVDVSRRMTIPEILAHAWLQNVTPGIVYVPAPPVSELARPLKSAAHIDRDLFESLRVIWGRHADPDSLTADLLSPPGEGTLAKVFYFLLYQHREKSLEERGFIMDLTRSYTSSRDGNDKRKVITKQYTAPHSIIPHSNQLTVTNLNRAPGRLNRAIPAPASRCISPLQIPNLAPPPMSKTDSRSRTPSPCGPRPPRPRPLSTPISSPPPHNSPHVRTGPNFALSMGDSSAHPSRNSRTPTPSHFSNFTRAGPDNPGSPSHARTSTYVQQASLPETPRNPLAVKYPAPLVMGQRRNTVSPTSTQPMHLHAPKPIPIMAPLSPIPMLTAPRTDNPVVQRTIDDITERVNVLVARGNNAPFMHQLRDVADNNMVQTLEHQSRLPRAVGSQLPAAVAPSHRLGDSRRDRVSSGADKENRVVDVGNYFTADQLEKGEGLGLSKSQIPTDLTFKKPLDHTHGENRQGAVAGGRKMKDKKERGLRPAPLTLQPPPLNTKRSTLSNVTSPTLTSPPALLSPVVGEFKGWFSNLFNWKAQSYVLHSHDDLHTTRDETIRLLEQFGVVVSADDADGIPMLRCRVDEGLDLVTGLAVQKRTIFRVEFLCPPNMIAVGGGRSTGNGNGHGNGTHLTTPRVSQDGFSSNTGPTTRTSAVFGKNNAFKMVGYQCAIVLVQEKGSMSAFRGLARRLKEGWLLDSGLQSPGLGGMGGDGGRMTPLAEQVHRFI